MNKTEPNATPESMRPGREERDAAGPAKRPYVTPRFHRLLSGETAGGKVIDASEITVTTIVFAPS